MPIAYRPGITSPDSFRTRARTSVLMPRLAGRWLDWELPPPKLLARVPRDEEPDVDEARCGLDELVVNTGAGWLWDGWLRVEAGAGALRR